MAVTASLPGPSGRENVRRMREIFSDPASVLDRAGPDLDLGLGLVACPT